MATPETTDNPLPDVKRISTREARNQFSDLIGQVHYTGEPVIIERSGKPMVAVVPVDVLEQHLSSSLSATMQDAVDPEQTPQAVREAKVHYAPPSTPLVELPMTSMASQTPGLERRQPTRHSQFGLFPELAVIEFGDDFDEIKQLWRDSMTKQLKIIQGEVSA